MMSNTGVLIKSVYLFIVAILVTWYLVTHNVQTAAIALVIAWLFGLILDDVLDELC